MKTINFSILFLLLIFIISGCEKEDNELDSEIIEELPDLYNWHNVSSPGVNLVILTSMVGYTSINRSAGYHGAEYYLKKSSDGMVHFENIRFKSGDLGCYSLSEMFFCNRDTGFIAENCAGTLSILRTTDGGASWEYINAGAPIGLSMFFLDPNLGYYSFHLGYYPTNIQESYLMKFEEDTSRILLSTKKYVFDENGYSIKTRIHFIDNSTGFIATKDSSANSVILKTINGGEDWEETVFFEDFLFNDIAFVTDSIGFIIGDNGLLLKTEDRGNTWTLFNSSTGFNLESISIAKNGTGYIVGDQGTILKTTDFGESWQSESFIDDSRLIYIKYFPDTLCYINTSSGQLYRKLIKL